MIKALTVKMLISLAAVALVAAFFAFALIVGARAVALAHSGQENFLLVTLALLGAGVSVVNGFGRRTGIRAFAAHGAGVEAEHQAVSHSASLMNPGY